jgi:CelD/BcsL family acetyltransferase involved in cellulose biosynthesis
MTSRTTVPLAVDEVRDAGTLASYEPEWSALVAASPDGSFFDTPEWLRSWIAAFWSPRPIAFQFVRAATSLIGLAPLLPDDGPDAWCRHTLTLPRHSHVPRAEVVAAPGARRDVLDALLAHARARTPSMPLVLAGIDRESPTRAEVEPLMASRRQTTAVWDEPRIPWVRIAGDWDGYLRSRSSHLRTELRRKRRRLERSGAVTVKVAGEPHERDAALADVMRVERASWKHEQGTSIETEPGAATFYSTLAERASANGWLRIFLLYLDDVPIAHLFGIVYKNTYLALKTSYDQSRRDLSPGVVLIEHALHDAFDRGLAAFDLLGVEARWKNELATDVRDPVTVCVFNSTCLSCRTCRTFHQRVKPVLKRRAGWLLSLHPGSTRFARQNGRVVTPPAPPDEPAPASPG